MRMLRVIGLAMVCTIGLAAPSFAASPEPEIVVTAATPLGRGPTGFGSFSSQDLQDGHGADLTDYLRRSAAGVFINDVQNNPLQPDVSYRGFTASPLLGTPQGLSVYVDGVRLNHVSAAKAADTLKLRIEHRDFPPPSVKHKDRAICCNIDILAGLKTKQSFWRAHIDDPHDLRGA